MPTRRRQPGTDPARRTALAHTRPATAEPCCRSRRRNGPPPPGGSAIPGHAALDELPVGLGPASGPRPVLSPDRRRTVRAALGDRLGAAIGAAASARSPRFRGAYVSRPPAEIVAEATLAGRAGRPRGPARQRELLVLRQADLGDIRLLESLPGPIWLPVDGLDWVRVSRTCSRPRCGPASSSVMASTPGVVAATSTSRVPARNPRRCCAGCGGSATCRQLPDPPGGQTSGSNMPQAGSQEQRHLAGFLARPRPILRRAGAVPRRRCNWMPSASSATRTRTPSAYAH